MVSTLIETININADDFTDNFLTCPTCMSAYDEGEHTPKLLPCSHTLCKSCLERIAATSIPFTGAVANPNQSSNTTNSNLVIRNYNSLSRSVAAADAAAATVNSPHLATRASNFHRLSAQATLSDQCFRCPICRETIVVPRTGGVSALPPSFIVNQLLDLIKHQRRDLVPHCTNHPNEELLFCETCDTSFCSICESHCRVVSNSDHIVIPFSIAIKRMTEILLFKSSQCVNSFNLALSSVRREIDNLNSTVLSINERVEFSFNELHLVLDKRKEDLLRDLNQIKMSKTKVLGEQMQLIANEKSKVEAECKLYHQSNIESKVLSAQIQALNEKLDGLRGLFEPRENSFINYEYKFNDVIEQVEESLKKFGRFRVSNTYPPLCVARVLDTPDLSRSASSSPISSSSSSSSSFFSSSFNSSAQSICSTHSANLSVYIQVDTVDYFGQRRTEGGDPVNVLITDPLGRQISLTHEIQDLKSGSYICKFVPSTAGKYRIDVSIFLRPISQMPLFVNVVEHVDSLWTFGGSNGATMFNKGNAERDLNMPISVRYHSSLIYILDAGNNRIKVLNKNGQFVRHIKHQGISDTSCTALVITNSNPSSHRIHTINWRSKLFSDYQINLEGEILNTYELNMQEPIGLSETFCPNLFLIQDKKKLNLISNIGTVIIESLEIKVKNECNIKNISSFCGHLTKRRIFLADLTNTSASIYEIDLDWLCDYKLDETIEKSGFTFRKYHPNQTPLSNSSSSLNSSISVLSSTTVGSQNTSGGGATRGTYTAIWFDMFSSKLLAAKCDKQKTVIEVFNSECGAYEYSIESGKNEKNLKRVTSMSSTDDGKVVCADLVQNCVKMFRFI